MIQLLGLSVIRLKRPIARFCDLLAALRAGVSLVRCTSVWLCHCDGRRPCLRVMPMPTGGARSYGVSGFQPEGGDVSRCSAPSTGGARSYAVPVLQPGGIVSYFAGDAAYIYGRCTQLRCRRPSACGVTGRYLQRQSQYLQAIHADVILQAFSLPNQAIGL